MKPQEIVANKDYQDVWQKSDDCQSHISQMRDDETTVCVSKELEAKAKWHCIASYWI